jgi:hypothetical protein
VPLSVAFPATY